MTQYYPLFVNLAGKRCLVVGAGPVAAGKIPPLLDGGADVTVVSPEAVPAIRRWHDQGRLTWVRRKFRDADLEGRFLAIAAASEPEANQRVFDLGEARQMLVNVVDETDRCNFIVPSIARSGPVQVAVSSSGTCPTLAKNLRRRIEESLLGEETGRVAEFMARWRPASRARIPSFEQKREFWNKVMASEIVELAARGDWAEADRRMEALFEREGFGSTEPALA